MNVHPAAIVNNEFVFTARDFERIRTLVLHRAGISMAESKREMVYARLVRRLRQLKMPNFATYLERLEAGDEVELQLFCNALTTNLTAFFRERHHFDWLASTCLPQLVRANADSRRMRFWSAGCSTGEEAYSIAMVIRENLGHLRDWDVRILATDIDSDVLAHARAGRYTAERVSRIGGQRPARWFTTDGNSHVVGDALRSLVTFGHLNLMEDWPFRGPFDVIFCRNVIIYFDKQTQTRLIGRMTNMQRGGDHLVLGHSESLLGVSTAYETVGPTIHRKIAT